EGGGGVGGSGALSGSSVPVVGLGGVVPWVVSGRSAGALCEQAGRLAACVGGVGSGGIGVSGVGEVGRALVVSRSVFEHRAVVVGGDREGLVGGLGVVAGGGSGVGVVVGRVGVGVGRSVFVFPGQGSQWVGMAVGLLEGSEVFAG
ncbi:hypothetical protein ACPXCE_29755, partial [Streptomyces sp. DT24]